MQIGVIPPSLDQVMIGDMKRNENRKKVKNLYFFLGINEGVIPAANDGGGVVNDHQREVLETYGINLRLASNSLLYGTVLFVSYGVKTNRSFVFYPIA